MSLRNGRLIAIATMLAVAIACHVAPVSAQPRDEPRVPLPEPPETVGEDLPDPPEGCPDVAPRPPSPGLAEDESPRTGKPPERPAICSEAEIARAHERTRAAVVRVVATGASGRGIMFHSPRHVLTAFTIIATGRDVTVTFHGSEPQPATVVAVDEERGLALLELEHQAPAGVAPLLASDRKLLVGTPLLLASPRWPDLDQLAIKTGNVTSLVEGDPRTDFNSWEPGSPLLDCRGRVVAVTTDWWSEDIKPVAAATELIGAIGQQAPYTGQWSILHPSVGLKVMHDHGGDSFVGLSLGTALIGKDRFYLPLRLSFSALAEPEDPDATVTRTGARLQLEAGIGYRWQLLGGELPLYLVPTLGGAVQTTFTREIHKAEVITRSDCSPQAPCQTETVKTELPWQHSWSAGPTAGLGLALGPAELSYQLQLNVKDPQSSTHQWYLGLQF